MTEYNIFCYSEKINDENSFQQKRYRAFNKEVGKKRYEEILKEVRNIFKDFKLNLKSKTWNKAWQDCPVEVLNKLKDIPEYNKECVEYITGRKIDNIEEMTVEEICKELGRDIKIKN